MRDFEKYSRLLGLQIPIEDQILMGGTPYATRRYTEKNTIAQTPNLVEIKKNQYRIDYTKTLSDDPSCPTEPTNNTEENE